MAKNCSVCGNRISIMTSRLKFQDGTICSNCYKKAGLKGKSMNTHGLHRHQQRISEN